MKTEGFLGLGLAVLLLLAVLLYVQGYANAIQNSTTVDAQTKVFVSVVPMFLAIGIFVLTGLFIVVVAIELRKSV
jgi:uncharacterized membrane protein YidH (DUF202 family)